MARSRVYPVRAKANAAGAATTNFGTVPIDDSDEVVIYLDADAGTGTTPTLNVKAQVSLDGVAWFDLPSGAFTQVVGASLQMLRLTTIGAGSLRLNAVIAGTTPAFTYGLTVATKLTSR